MWLNGWMSSIGNFVMKVKGMAACMGFNEFMNLMIYCLVMVFQNALLEGSLSDSVILTFF